MQKKTNTLKAALLSLSLLAIMTGAPIAPILGEVSKTYPDASSTTIQMVLTLPSIFIMVVSILTGQLAVRVPKRKLLFAGLGLFVLGGVAGVFAPTLTLLLVSRSILGIGVGIISPLSTSLIADFFSGEERAQMVGYSQSSRTFVGILVGPIVGIIAASNWRNVFWIYLLGVVILLVAVFFIPEPATEKTTKQHPLIKPGQLPKAVWLFALYMLLHRLSFFIIPTNLAVFVNENGWGGSQLSGWAISMITLASFVVALFFSRLYKLLGRWMGMLSTAFLALGFVILLLGNGVFGLMLSMVLMGASQGMMFPLLFFQTAQECSSQQRTLAIALISSMRFLAQFIVPYVFAGLGWLFNTTAIRDYFWIDVGLMTVGLLIGCGMLIYNRKETVLA